jgi:Putative DNA-binding domain
LHRALGLEQSPLSFELIKRAVEQHVAQAEDLDWTEALPGQDQRAKAGLAKDVAALLNTRGGLIVYGVADQGTGEAREIKPVDTGEAERLRLGSIASSNIHPRPAGLDAVGVDDPNTPGHGVVVLIVPQSSDAPHLVGSQEKFGVPFRDGPSTRWMREPDIERAYRDRFIRQADQQSWLASEIADVANRLDLQQSIWLVASARPRSTTPAVSGPLASSDVTATLEEALSAGHRLVPDQSDVGRPQLIKALNNAAQDPQVDLRRWMVYPGSVSDLEKFSRDVHVELHHDGPVTLAAAVGGWMQPLHSDADNVPARLIESFAIEFVALIQASASRGYVAGTPYAVRVDFLRQNQAVPIVLIDNVRVAGMTLSTSEVVANSRRLMMIRPVLLDVFAPDEDAALLGSAREIATDVLSQFGVSRLVHIPPPASD